MKTVSFKSVLERVARLWLGDMDEVTYSTAQKRRMADAINAAVRVGVEHADWQELVRVAERPFRPHWDAEASYAAGTEVWHADTEAYWYAVRGNAGVEPGTSDDDWAEVESLDRYLAWSMSGFWPVASVLGVFDADPVKGQAGRFDFVSDYRGVWPQDCTEDTVWLRYRMMPPVFTVQEVDDGGEEGEPETIVLGDLRYFPDEEECYLALVNDAGDAVWSKVPMPYFLSNYVPLKAAAELHAADEKRFAVFSAQAEDELDRAYVAVVLRNADRPEPVGFRMEG